MFKLSELIKATGAKRLNVCKDKVAPGISIDTRTLKTGEAFIAIRGDNFDGHNFIGAAIKKGASIIISEFPKGKLSGLSKGVSYLQVKNTTKALGDIACFHRKRFDIPVIAVTGSNGKTTTKDMVAWVLGGKFKVLKNEGTKNNHIGLPMTLLKLDSSYDFAVLEAGTNHPGEIGYLAKICLPNVAVITNIGPAHLEHFKTLLGVYKEKISLLGRLQFPKIAILNGDDKLLRKAYIKKSSDYLAFGFGLKKKADFSAQSIRNSASGTGFKVKKYGFTLNTFGVYNIYNALAAISVARVFGLRNQDIAARLRSFEFPQSRLRLVKLKKAVFIDDTYNANPASFQQAILALSNFGNKGRKILVMGDMLELGGKSADFHMQIGKMACKVCDVFIAVGRLSSLATEAAIRNGFNKEKVFNCQNSTRAKEILFNNISPSASDIVLVKGSRGMKMEEVFKI